MSEIKEEKKRSREVPFISPSDIRSMVNSSYDNPEPKIEEKISDIFGKEWLNAEEIDEIEQQFNGCLFDLNKLIFDSESDPIDIEVLEKYKRIKGEAKSSTAAATQGGLEVMQKLVGKAKEVEEQRKHIEASIATYNFLSRTSENIQVWRDIDVLLKTYDNRIDILKKEIMHEQKSQNILNLDSIRNTLVGNPKLGEWDQLLQKKEKIAGIMEQYQQAVKQAQKNSRQALSNQHKKEIQEIDSHINKKRTEIDNIENLQKKSKEEELLKALEEKRAKKLIEFVELDGKPVVLQEEKQLQSLISEAASSQKLKPIYDAEREKQKESDQKLRELYATYSKPIAHKAARFSALPIDNLFKIYELFTKEENGILPKLGELVKKALNKIQEKKASQNGILSSAISAIKSVNQEEKKHVVTDKKPDSILGEITEIFNEISSEISSFIGYEEEKKSVAEEKSVILEGIKNFLEYLNGRELESEDYEAIKEISIMLMFRMREALETYTAVCAAMAAHLKQASDAEDIERDHLSQKTSEQLPFYLPENSKYFTHKLGRERIIKLMKCLEDAETPVNQLIESSQYEYKTTTGETKSAHLIGGAPYSIAFRKIREQYEKSQLVMPAKPQTGLDKFASWRDKDELKYVPQTWLFLNSHEQSLRNLSKKYHIGSVIGGEILNDNKEEGGIRFVDFPLLEAVANEKLQTDLSKIKELHQKALDEVHTIKDISIRAALKEKLSETLQVLCSQGSPFKDEPTWGKVKTDFMLLVKNRLCNEVNKLITNWFNTGNLSENDNELLKSALAYAKEQGWSDYIKTNIGELLATLLNDKNNEQYLQKFSMIIGWFEKYSEYQLPPALIVVANIYRGNFDGLGGLTEVKSILTAGFSNEFSNKICKQIVDYYLLDPLSSGTQLTKKEKERRKQVVLDNPVFFTDFAKEQSNLEPPNNLYEENIKTLAKGNEIEAQWKAIIDRMDGHQNDSFEIKSALVPTDIDNLKSLDILLPLTLNQSDRKKILEAKKKVTAFCDNLLLAATTSQEILPDHPDEKSSHDIAKILSFASDKGARYITWLFRYFLENPGDFVEKDHEHLREYIINNFQKFEEQLKGVLTAHLGTIENLNEKLISVLEIFCDKKMLQTYFNNILENILKITDVKSKTAYEKAIENINNLISLLKKHSLFDIVKEQFDKTIKKYIDHTTTAIVSDKSSNDSLLDRLSNWEGMWGNTEYSEYVTQQICHSLSDEEVFNGQIEKLKKATSHEQEKKILYTYLYYSISGSLLLRQKYNYLQCVAAIKHDEIPECFKTYMAVGSLDYNIAISLLGDQYYEEICKILRNKISISHPVPMELLKFAYFFTKNPNKNSRHDSDDDLKIKHLNSTSLREFIENIGYKEMKESNVQEKLASGLGHDIYESFIGNVRSREEKKFKEMLINIIKEMIKDLDDYSKDTGWFNKNNRTLAKNAANDLQVVLDNKSNNTKNFTDFFKLFEDKISTLSEKNIENWGKIGINGEYPRARTIKERYVLKLTSLNESFSNDTSEAKRGAAYKNADKLYRNMLLDMLQPYNLRKMIVMDRKKLLGSMQNVADKYVNLLAKNTDKNASDIEFILKFDKLLALAMKQEKHEELEKTRMQDFKKVFTPTEQKTFDALEAIRQNTDPMLDEIFYPERLPEGEMPSADDFQNFLEMYIKAAISNPNGLKIIKQILTDPSQCLFIVIRDEDKRTQTVTKYGTKDQITSLFEKKRIEEFKTFCEAKGEKTFDALEAIRTNTDPMLSQTFHPERLPEGEMPSADDFQNFLEMYIKAAINDPKGLEIIKQILTGSVECLFTVISNEDKREPTTAQYGTKDQIIAFLETIITSEKNKISKFIINFNFGAKNIAEQLNQQFIILKNLLKLGVSQQQIKAAIEDLAKQWIEHCLNRTDSSSKLLSTNDLTQQLIAFSTVPLVKQLMPELSAHEGKQEQSAGSDAIIMQDLVAASHREKSLSAKHKELIISISEYNQNKIINDLISQAQKIEFSDVGKLNAFLSIIERLSFLYNIGNDVQKALIKESVKNIVTKFIISYIESSAKSKFASAIKKLHEILVESIVTEEEYNKIIESKEIKEKIIEKFEEEKNKINEFISKGYEEFQKNWIDFDYLFKNLISLYQFGDAALKKAIQTFIKEKIIEILGSLKNLDINKRFEVLEHINNSQYVLDFIKKENIDLHTSLFTEIGNARKKTNEIKQEAEHKNDLEKLRESLKGNLEKLNKRLEALKVSFNEHLVPVGISFRGQVQQNFLNSKPQQEAKVKISSFILQINDLISTIQEEKLQSIQEFKRLLNDLCLGSIMTGISLFLSTNKEYLKKNCSIKEYKKVFDKGPENMKEAIVEITEVCNSLTRNSGEINVAHHDHEVKG